MTAQATAHIRVMLVDDHALIRSAIRQALSVPDIEVVAEAGSAEEALTLAPAVRPDVLLLDIDLPGMDGVSLVRELAPRLPDTRIVMLTVASTDLDVEIAIRSGARGYLTKDMTPDALLRAVRSVVHGDLAMSRGKAARLVAHLVDDSRRGRVQDRDPALAQLTEREEGILRLMADGLTDRAIAESLTISPRTVETHVSNILHKLGARNRAEAADRYRRER